MKYTALSPEEVRQKTYEETKKQFLLHGIRGTDMKHVAQTVGIGRTTLYRYYPSREQLAFMVSFDLAKRMVQFGICLNEENSLNGYEKYRKLFDNIIVYILENIEILSFFSEFDALFEDSYPDFPEAHDYDAKMDKLLNSIASFMEEGQRDGSIVKTENPTTYTVIVLHSVIGLAQRIVSRNVHYHNGEIESKAVLEKLAHTLIDAIRA